jgi:hypothetical protein
MPVRDGDSPIHRRSTGSPCQWRSAALRHLWDGTHDRRDKRVRIGPRPDTVVTYVGYGKFRTASRIGGSSAQPQDRPQQIRPLACARTIGHPERSDLSKSACPKPCSRTDYMRWHPLLSQRSSCGRDNSTPAHVRAEKMRTTAPSSCAAGATILRLGGLPSSIRDPVIHQIKNRRDSDRNQKKIAKPSVRT